MVVLWLTPLLLALMPKPEAVLFLDEEKYLQRTASSWAEDLQQALPAKRRAAAFALGRLGVHALPHLGRLKQAAQQDADASVRVAVITTLGELGTFSASEVVPVLITVMEKDKTIAVQRSAIMALGKLGDRAVLAEASLRTVLKDADPGKRQNAAWALGELGKAAVPSIPGLTEALEDNDAGVRRDVVRALGNLGALAQEAIPSMAKHLQDKDAQVQEEVILVIRQFGPLASSALSPLLELAESQAQSVALRKMVLLTIEQIWPQGQKEPLAWKRLERIAQETKPVEVKQAASETVKKISKLRE
jgi:HEAT repeat protein